MTNDKRLMVRALAIVSLLLIFYANIMALRKVRVQDIIAIKLIDLNSEKQTSVFTCPDGDVFHIVLGAKHEKSNAAQFSGVAKFRSTSQGSTREFKFEESLVTQCDWLRAHDLQAYAINWNRYRTETDSFFRPNEQYELEVVSTNLTARHASVWIHYIHWRPVFKLNSSNQPLPLHCP